MSKKPHIVVLAGSLRKDSCNKKIAKIAAKSAEDAGAQVTYIDLADYPMPLYDGDIEESQGIPSNGLKLKVIFEAADGFIIASPEYNSSISAVLKNTIDWVSRQKDKDEKPLSAYTDKTALLLSASPGALGGLRGLVHLRSLLSNINVYVLPGQKTISNAYEAFDDKGHLKKESDLKSVDNLVIKFIETTRKLKG